MAGMQTIDEESALELPFHEGREEEDRFDSLALEGLDENPFAAPFDSHEAGEDTAETSVSGIAEFVAGPTLRPGSSGPGVMTLQRALTRLGHTVGADGRFGPGTARAVKAFQSRSGIMPDGVAGPRTKAAIAAALGGSLVVPTPARSASTTSGRLVVDRHPLMRSHRGTSPDLVLRWNRIDRPGAVDVVVHFHGYSGQAQAMRIDRHKEAHSGLDFADPSNVGTAGRTQPTIGVLARGNYFGGQSGSGYNFPALVRPGAVRELVQDALQRVSRETSHSLQLGRLILTGHSGGGAPISAVVADTDPDEVQVFDGTYGSGDSIAAWAQRRIARELDSPSGSPPALRVLYRRGTPTAAQAQSIWERVCRSLHDPRAAHLTSRFRVESTPVAHNDIPSRFGWRLLADVGADLPEATPLACTHGVKREALDTGEEAEASPYWQAPANEQEQSLQEAISVSTQDYSESEEGYDANEDYIFSEDEGLAWLDVEATEEEAESNEALEDEGLSSSEQFEPEEAALTFEMLTIEQLIDAEENTGSGIVERIKGVAAFALGPTLRQGSAGPGVETLQRCLVRLGHSVSVDGKFGPGTERAVRAFQSSAGMTVDGVCGPRTKAAIAAAVSGNAGPLPGPVPSPTPGAASLADAIVRVAEAQYRRWHSTGKLRETDTAAVPILQEYYREGVKTQVSAAELQDTVWQRAHPWSAVFVSYVMRTAGAGAAFRYSPGHQDYIAAARRNRLDNVISNPFWAYRVAEVAPEVGDLVCADRENSGANYDNIGDKRRRKTHCDIVTEVRPGSLRVIGGNVNNMVDARTIRTQPDGRLALDGGQARFFAVLRCRGSVGSAQVGSVAVPTTSSSWIQVPGDQRMRAVMTLLVEKHGYPVNAAAGIVGNLWAESAVLPNRLEGSGEATPLRARDFAGVMRDFTPEEVMNRNLNARIGPRLPGIGLAQWTDPRRRSGLFRHPYDGRSLGAAILDHMAAQVDYLVTELRNGYRGLDRILRDPAVSIEAASDEFVYSFEIPGAILTPRVPGRSRQRRQRGDTAVQEVFSVRRRASARALAAYRALAREVVDYA